MAKGKQLTVSWENRPGTLAHVATVFGDAKVNILAFVTTITGAEGSVQLVVDNVNKAKKALDGAGLSYAEADVLHVELPHLPRSAGIPHRKAGRQGDQHHVRLCDDCERRSISLRWLRRWGSARTRWRGRGCGRARTRWWSGRGR